MSDELYCYPGSSVLKNKMEIRDMEQLHDEMLEASRESFLCEYGAMERLFRKCLRKR